MFSYGVRRVMVVANTNSVRRCRLKFALKSILTLSCLLLNLSHLKGTRQPEKLTTGEVEGRSGLWGGTLSVRREAELHVEYTLDNIKCGTRYLGKKSEK